MNSGVTRRSWLATTLTIVAGAVAGFVYGRNNDAATAISTGSGYRYPGTSGRRTLLVGLSAIPVNGGVITSGVVIIRQSGDVVQAFSSRCTHLGCTVNRVTAGRIFCPCHGSVFDASTGAVIQGPATAPLPPVRVSVRNGGVYKP